MRILMTGSTGFTGKFLVRMLEDSGYEICHLVRNKKGFKKELVWDFVGPLPKSLPSCDIVVHLAAHVNFSRNLELIQYNTNTVSTIKLVSYAKAINAHFIFASMVGVHGSQFTLIDADTPINPENHYALSKYIAEKVIQEYLNNYIILRICGIYGLEGPDHLGLNIALRNAVYNKVRPVLKGNGKARRNYICVYDVAQWILYLIKKYESTKHSDTTRVKEILYLAGPEVMTIEKYLELITKVILPGMEMERIEGSESKDLIVKASRVSFPRLTFIQYLESILSSG